MLSLLYGRLLRRPRGRRPTRRDSGASSRLPHERPSPGNSPRVPGEGALPKSAFPEPRGTGGLLIGSMRHALRCRYWKGATLRIKDVLRHKGSAVVTVGPEATVHDLLAALSEHAVGALVVSTDGQQVDGIVSERDVVRRLHDDGADLLNQTVASIMTSDVHTCGPEDLIDDLMRAMTERRIRHIPVVVDGQLAGIVSIGDIVKFRMDELETERRQLQDYISS